MAHLGPRVSALLDGRLSPKEEERCWTHVHHCHACRDLVEREGWVKTRLASMSLDPADAPDRLKDSLLAGSALTLSQFPTAQRSRHRGLSVIGGGAAGVAVVGVLALGAAAGPNHVEPRPPAADLTRPTSSQSPAVDAPRPVVGPTRAPLADRLLGIRGTMAP